jgi:hypothetical protein
MDNSNTISLTGIIITHTNFHLMEEVSRHNKLKMKGKTVILILHNSDVLLH